MKTTGILVCGHGSRKEEGVRGLIDFAKRIQATRPHYIVSCCFLDLSEPFFATEVDRLYQLGVRQIIAAPAFLFGGVQVNYELPQLIAECRSKYSDLTIVLAHYIGISEPVIKQCAENIGQVSHQEDLAHRQRHCLLTVGAGASVSTANGDVAKLTRMIWEECGFGLAQYSFVSRATFPSVQEMLKLIELMGYEQIIVLPLMFFPGVYTDKIYLAAEEFRIQSPVQVRIADPLGSGDLLIQAMNLRIDEAAAELGLF